MEKRTQGHVRPRLIATVLSRVRYAFCECGVHTVLTKTLITIGIFLSLFSYASAQNFVPASYQYPGSGDTDYPFGFVVGTELTILHTATTSLAGINAISIAGCVYLPTGGGNVYLEVWYNGTTTPYSQVASSSLALSNFYTCSGGIPISDASSSVTFLLNTPVNATAGDSLYFKFRLASGATSIYWAYENKNPASAFIGFLNGNVPYVYTGKFISAFMKLESGLFPYSTSWADLVNASLGNTCDGIFECAFAWAFAPSPESLAQFQNLSFASSSPFGYIYDLDTAYQSFMTGLNATTTNFKITLDMTTLKNTSSVFNGVSTSSITVFDVCWVNRQLGELPANSFRDTFLPMIVFMMWIGLGWLFYSVAHRIW